MHSLILLEPSLLSVASAQAFFAKAGPAFDAFASGKHEQALQIFMTAASGLPWEQCRALLEQRVPGSVAQSLKDADTFFGVELPALQQWSFTPAQAATIRQPTLSVVGTKTSRCGSRSTRCWRRRCRAPNRARSPDVGHLLHIQAAQPVAKAMAAFIGRNPIRA